MDADSGGASTLADRARRVTDPPVSLWRDLRRYTTARVALGRAGNGMPTAAHLDFQAAHAAARDAVHTALDVALLASDLREAGFCSIVVRSAAADRQIYLRRPDFGRRLHPDDRVRLPYGRSPLAIVICDGLSPLAVQRHAVPLLRALRKYLPNTEAAVIVQQGRVAIGDDIGTALGADAVAVLIGERPGLSAADSMGVYLTWSPRIGRSDSERNCISNIRAEGLPPEMAAAKLAWLITRMRALRLTGIGLKDDPHKALSSPD